MNTSVGNLARSLAVVLGLHLSGACVDGAQFDDKLSEATDALRRMGEAPEAVRSAHYHVLYVGRKEFADERKRVLEKVRKNFLGFMRRMHLKINTKHEKLLVIVVDTQSQMQRFHEEVSPDDPPIPSWAAGYYSPEHNWAVFYNQRKGQNVAETEEWLNRMATKLVNARGGPDTRLYINTPTGWVKRSKRQIGQDMTAKWKEVIGAVNEFNTALTQHEGVHQLAFNVGVQQRGARYPFWLSEGLACQFEVPAAKKGRRRMGAARVNGLRLAKFRESQATGKVLGLHKFLALDLEDSVDSVEAAYAEAWATFAFFFKRYPKELSAYVTHLAQRKPAAEGEEIDEVAAFGKFFDKPILDLQEQMKAHIERLK